MMGPTHALGGVTAWTLAAAVLPLDPDQIVLGTGLAVAGALAVDIDHRSSDASQFARMAGGGLVAVAVLGVLSQQVMSRPQWAAVGLAGLLLASLSWITRPRCGKYRGVVHSWWGLAFCCVAALAPCLFTGWPWWAGVAIVTGWVSHLALDALTKEGLPVLWPDMTRWGWLPKDMSVTTGGKSRRKKRKARGHGWRRPAWTHSGAEYAVVQPALAVLAVAGLLLDSRH